MTIGRPRTLPDTPAVERRRETFREAKRRAAERRRNDRPAHTAAVEAFLDKLINSGNGSAERRQVMLDILARRAAQ